MNELTYFGGAADGASLLSLLVVFVTWLAMACSLVTEFVKELPGIQKVPTKLVCYIVAIVITTPAFVAAMAYLKIPVEWYSCFASFLASFVVAKVAMGGWDDMTELYGRLKGNG